jgi:hypothetical protein
VWWRLSEPGTAPLPAVGRQAPKQDSPRLLLKRPSRESQLARFGVAGLSTSVAPPLGPVWLEPKSETPLESGAVPGSFRIEQTFAAATEPGEDLKTNLEARAPGFGAESVSAELRGDEWTVKATFHVDTREEAEARLASLLEASGFPPSATSSGATKISEVDE